jgi:hypothetical protein
VERQGNCSDWAEKTVRRLLSLDCRTNPARIDETRGHVSSNKLKEIMQKLLRFRGVDRADAAER